MNKLKEMANKVTYETACLMLDIDGLIWKVDKEYILSQEEKEFYYGVVEGYRAGIREDDIGNWEAIKYVVWMWIHNLKLRVFRHAVILAIKGTAREA